MTVFLTNAEHEHSIFPGGETHVRLKNILTCPDFINIKAILNGSEDIMHLLLLADAINRANKRIGLLEIPYLPYARQDRVCNPGESFSLGLMAGIINSLGAMQVNIYDPHSDVCGALIENANIIDISSSILGVRDIIKDQIIICPDAGAEKRILKLKMPYIMATKVRDPLTTNIIATKVYAEDSELKGKNCIIIDDICDGGRTFIELGKELKKKGANKVSLYVTHGIFSKGFEVFKGVIDEVYFFDYEQEKILWKDIV